MAERLLHALTCRPRRHYRRWRWGQPYWRDDQTAQMLGVARFGCPRCGRGSIAERDAFRLRDAGGEGRG